MRKFYKISFFVKYYLPLFLWMGVVFYLSSIPGNGYQGPHTVWFYIERKGAHILEYFILTLLVARLFKAYQVNAGKKYFWIIILPLLFAFSDEFHQSFVFSREGKILDVLVDLAGIVLAASVYYAAKLKLFTKRP